MDRSVMGGWSDGSGDRTATYRWAAGGALGLIGALVVALWANHGKAIDEMKAKQEASLSRQAAVESRLTRIEVIAERTALDVSEIRRLTEAREDRRLDRSGEHPR